MKPAFSTRRKLLPALAVICILSPGLRSAAQQIDCEFWVYQLDVKFADAFQAELMRGGVAAIKATGMMPELVKQRKALLKENFKVSLPYEGRVQEISSNRTLQISKFWKVPEGLQVEAQGRSHPASEVFDIDFVLQYAEKSRGKVSIQSVTTSVCLKSGVPLLLSRYEEGNEVQMIVGEATIDGEATGEPKQTSLFYYDVAFYKSSADAQAGRDPVARIMAPAVAGHLVSTKLERRDPKDYDSENPVTEGLHTLVGSKSNEDGAILVHAKSGYVIRKTGTEPGPNGERVPKVEIRQAESSAVMQTPGETKIFEVQISRQANPTAELDTWKETVSYQVYHPH